MGARIMPPKKLWQDELRERIDAKAAIDLLNDCVAGKVEPTAIQVKSAEILLRKKLPDLASVQLSDSNGGPIRQEAGLTIIYGGNNVHPIGTDNASVLIEQQPTANDYGPLRVG